MPPRTLADLVADGTGEGHLYASLAPVYKFIYDHHFDYDDQLAVVREAVPADATSILEGGCGTGQLLARLAAEFDRVVGVDRNPEMVAFAREAAPTADVLVADVRSVCFEPGFDAVALLGRVVPHLLTDDATTELFGNCYANLDPGGVVVFNTFDLRGLEDGYRKEETFTSAEYEVTRRTESRLTAPEEGRWEFYAEYTITDTETGETVVADETMPLRAHTPANLESSLRAVGFDDIALHREAAFSLRAVARKPGT